MKYFFNLMLIVLLLILAVIESTASSQSKSEFTVIRVGAYENAPKIFTDSTNQVRGIFPDILSIVAEKENWHLEYIPGSWTECLARLESNQIDIMVDVAFSKARAQKYAFTNESIFVNWGVLYTRKNLKIESFIDLQDLKIATMKGSIHTDGEYGIKNILKRFDIRCTILETDNYTSVFELLDKGSADVGVVNRLFGNLYENNYALAKTSIVFNPRHLKFAFPIGSERINYLRDRIDDHLKNLKTDPSSAYYYIINSYLSEGIAP